MNRALAWSLAASAGAVLLSSSASAAPPSPEEKGAPATFANATPRPKLVGPLDPVLKGEALKAEQDAWERRLDVCNRLRKIAVAGDDVALEKQADRLEEQATALYHRRVGRLGVRSAPTAPVAPATMASTPKPAPAPFKAVAQ